MNNVIDIINPLDITEEFSRGLPISRGIPLGCIFIIGHISLGAILKGHKYHVDFVANVTPAITPINVISIGAKVPKISAKNRHIGINISVAIKIAKVAISSSFG
ncbi:hypothetical protein ADU90_15165 [Clostridium botulinum]|nr:hypothetical protein [Clostridium botulinum]KOC51640.1 hypothetical protein ADU90_15165 [Clostridium botulinum]